MILFHNYQEQFDQVNDVVISLDELVGNLKNLSNITSDLMDSIIGLLEIAKKLIHLLPNTKPKENRIYTDKKDLIHALDMMIKSFDVKSVNKDFYVWWGIFGTYWSLYSGVIVNSDSGIDVFYLSLN